jgi:cell division protein ZapA
VDDKGGVVQVDIFGSQYTIRKGSEDPEYILRVAAYVDQKMREINERLPVASVSKVAVLTSLNLADELFKEREGLNRDRALMEHLSQSCAALDRELDQVE